VFPPFPVHARFELGLTATPTRSPSRVYGFRWQRPEPCLDPTGQRTKAKISSHSAIPSTSGPVFLYFNSRDWPLVDDVDGFDVCIANGGWGCSKQKSRCVLQHPATPKTRSANDASSSSSVPGVVFTGDTLFIAGCGVFFEGTGAEMHDAFERLRVAALPDATVTYVGHEYTAGNLRFARSVDPENAALVRLVGLVDQHPVTVGRARIGDEKEWNVFWRLTGEPVRYVIILNMSAHPS
jgi:hypothetical protein